MLSVAWQIILIGMFEPYTSKYEHNMELFNESMILVILYIYMCFSDFIENPETKFTMGFVCCIVVSLHFIGNILIIIMVNIREIFRARKEARRAKKMKMLKEQSV